MRVTVLDTETGERKEMPSSYNEYWWSEGNGSCDCNRKLFFGHDRLHGDPAGCIGSKRYIIIEAIPEDGEMPATLADLNQNYPPELLLKYGIKAWEAW